MGHPGAEVVVLLEGRSDVAAVRNLLADGDLAAQRHRVELVDMGGVTNVRSRLDELADRRPAARVLGLCDAADTRFVVRALTAHGLPVEAAADLPAVGFHVCEADLEEELIRALGVDRVLAVLDRHDLRERFETFRQQPAWQGRPVSAQLRRFAGVASGRKELLAGALAAALTPDRVPGPLRRLLDDLRAALDDAG
ncbi:hypothetical protein [Nocardioides donggukensis]|uniref:ATP-dependent endonuclease n=1 Tax=Nocardioides donggukensis TaxID=2774019 RepID=A0A927K6E9_9ACTN|nr:hypothetical protein [Nocardioides donggukensis]MBD8871177.1 hypothetical protein [Nocardioides donggukensis]